MLAWLLLFFIRVTNIEGPSCAGQGARSWRMRVTVSVFMASWYSFLLLFDSDHLTGKKKKWKKRKLEKRGKQERGGCQKTLKSRMTSRGSEIENQALFSLGDLSTTSIYTENFSLYFLPRLHFGVSDPLYPTIFT